MRSSPNPLGLSTLRCSSARFGATRWASPQMKVPWPGLGVEVGVPVLIQDVDVVRHLVKRAGPNSA